MLRSTKYILEVSLTNGYFVLGKQIIHPGQIDIVNKAFSPSEEKVNWARDLVKVFEKQDSIGKVS